MESSATCLDAGVDPVQLAGEHLAGVGAAIASPDVLRQRLAHLHRELSCARERETSARISALQAMRGAGPAADQTLRQYELSAMFTGGDSTLTAVVRSAWQHEPTSMSADPNAPRSSASGTAPTPLPARVAGHEAQ
ncbi:hypothetical protein [Streptomyces sp. CT34]|uniref:hypothetical protein n=1 Tax=Streptomyces sp. CT34 TaxID=1553907 RepID=UPI0005BD5017|nr:hypothetical protein [Streptomyces sp. CT34]